MPTTEFRTFQRYRFAGQADALVAALRAANIAVEVEVERPSLDMTFTGTELQEQHCVRIAANDFEAAHRILDGLAANALQSLRADHYLFDFSDAELLEILREPDAWSREDYLLAREILADHGHQYSDAQLEDMKAKRLQQLAEPKEANRMWIAIGWFSLLFMGFVAVALGLTYRNLKITLPDGSRVPAYNAESRKHGQWLLLAGSIVVAAWLLFIVVNTFGWGQLDAHSRSVRGY